MRLIAIEGIARSSKRRIAPGPALQPVAAIEARSFFLTAAPAQGLELVAAQRVGTSAPR
jgi:hypothetical protein